MRGRTYRFRPRVFPLSRPPDAGALLAALRGRRGLVALDSAAGWPRRFSLAAFDPLPVPAPARLSDLRALVARLRPAGGERPPGPFAGGFLGALSYDLGVAGEALALPRDPWGAPPIAGGLYTDFVVVEHARRRAHLVLGDEPGDGRPPLAARRDELAALLAPATKAGGDGGNGADGARGFEALGPLERRVPPAAYRACIEELRARIARGDLYQANLAHPFECRTRGDPLDLYLRLRRANPAPYMGFLRWEGGALLSASPELLLELEPGRARTRPIKGTAPRADDPRRDRALAAALLASEKDLAELAMIVDLERNDLGRVAVPGSVRVEGLATLRSYAGVHHLTADVTAVPAPGVDAVRVLASLFPGGSITGAPKLASMCAIAELEREGRGFFSGSLGFIDTRGRARFNILIRTLVWRPRPSAGGGAGAASAEGEVRYHVGGGITWSSSAAAEDEETLLKGARLAQVLEEITAPALEAR